MPNKKIIYGIDFQVDASEFSKVKQELRQIQQMSYQDFKLIDSTKTEEEFKKIKASAKELEQVFTESFNPKLGTLNVDHFKNSLNNLKNGTLKQTAEQMFQLGATGTNAFRNIVAQVSTAKKEIKETSHFLDSMKTTLFNTLKWSVSSSILNTFSGTIQQAWGFTKKLDSSLNDIRIVTGKSADEMERFAKQANKVARNLGATTTNYTNAALIYYQQGLNEEDVAARANVTVKAANVTGQSASEVSEQLTAVWNGYKVVAEEAELYIDKLAAVAANTAADLEELSTGMSKVASAAATMGVNIDQLSAQLSTIVSVTRQDASVVGTALKTIYARMGDLKVDGVDEFGTSLGDVSGQLKQMGIDVLDQKGNLRDMGTVIEEVADKWGTWTNAQQQAAAVAIAGKRQYNNLIALFENWSMYESALTTSQTSAGTLQKQQDIYMDSLEAKLNNLAATSEKLYDAFFNSESMGKIIDGASFLVDRFANLIDAIGGGGNALLTLGGIFTKVYGNDITKALTRTVENLGLVKRNSIEAKAELELNQQFQDLNIKDEAIQSVLDLKAKELKYSKLISQEEKEQIENYIKQKVLLENELLIEKEKQKKAEEFYKIHQSGKFKVDANVKTNFYRNAAGEATSSGLSSATGGIVKELTTDVQVQDLNNELEKLNSLKENFGEVAEEIRKNRQIIYSNINEPEIDDEKIHIRHKATQKGDLTDEGQKALKERKKILQEKDPKRGSKESSELKKIKETEIAIEKLGTATQKQIKIVEELLKKEGNYSQEQKVILEKYHKSLLTNGSERYKLEKETLKILDEVQTEYNENIEQLKTEGQAINELTEKQENLEKNRKDLEKPIDLKVNIKNFVELGQNILLCTGGIKALTSAFTVFKDESLSTGEQVEQFIAGVATGIFQIVPGIKSSIDTVVKAHKEGGSAAQKAWGWIGLVIQTIVIVVSLVASIVKMIPKQESALEKANKAFEKSKKIAEEAKTAAAELREEYQGILSDLSNYKNAKNALDGMREGTEEWKLAVEELNLQILDLISKYPQLMSMEGVISFENGQYSITQEGWDALLDEKKKQILNQNQTVALTSLGSTLAERKVIEKSSAKTFDKSILKLVDDIDDNYDKENKKLSLLTSSWYTTTRSAGSWTTNHIDKSGTNKANQLKSLGFVTEDRSVINPDGTAGSVYTDIDLSSLIGMNKKELVDLENKIKNLEDGKLKTTLSSLVDELQLNNEALRKNRLAVDQQRRTYLRAIAEEKGIDSEVYSNIGGDIIEKIESGEIASDSKDILNISVSKLANKLTTRTDQNREHLKGIFEEYGMEDDFKTYFNDVNDEHVGWKVNTKNDVKAIATYMESMVRYAYGKEVTIDKGKLDGRKEKNLGSFEITIPEIGTVKWSDVLLKAAEVMQGKAYTQFLEETESNLETLQDKGYNTNAAYFMGSADMSSSWENATGADISQLSGYGEDLGQTYTGRVKDFKDQFYRDASTLIANTGFEAENNRFLNFTLNDYKAFAENIDAAVAAGGGDAVKNLFSSITDPEQLKKINDEMSKVNWADASSVNEFRTALYEAGIYINESDQAWVDFMGKVNSGTQQWLNDQKKVIENLQIIKDIAGNIKIGDIISDEDYNKLLSIEPSIVQSFIKTSDGYQSLIEGDELSQKLKNNYNDLNSIKDVYEKINKLNEQIKYDSSLIFKEGTSEQTQNYFDRVLSADTDGSLLAAMGYDKAHIQSRLEASRNGDMAATDYLNNVGAQINQYMADVQNGLMKSAQAEEIWVTMIASSWKEISENSNLSTDTLNKAETLYKNKYLQELGLTFDDKTVKSLKIDNLEKAVIAARKLELDYLQEINSEIEKNATLMEIAFGSGMTALLEKQIENQKDAYNVAVQNEEWAKIVLNTALEGAGFEEGTTLTELLNARAAIEDPESTEAKNLDSLIEKWNRAEDVANAVAEASQAVIDGQIENYNYQLEMQDKITKSLRRLRDLAIEFDDFAAKGLSVFEKDTAADTIKKSLTALEDNRKDLGKIYGELDKYYNITDADLKRTENEALLEEIEKQNILGTKNNNISLPTSIPLYASDAFKDISVTYNSLLNRKNPFISTEYEMLSDPRNILQFNNDFIERYFKNSDYNRFYNEESGAFNAKVFEESFGAALDEAHGILTSMREELQTLYDSYLQTQDEMLELYDKEIQKLSTINNIYSTMADLSAIVGENTSQYYNNIASNLSKSYSLAEQQYATAQAEYNKLFKADGSRKDDISQEMYDKVADNLAAAANNLTDLAQQTLEAVANNFSAQIKEAVDNAIEATHELNLAAASESWELANAADEGYLDEVNARYGMDQLSRKIQTSIDDTDNYAAQKKLADLRAKQEQRLNDILEERGKLSQYELDRANAEYELTLKQIALEEAQQTANKMKLTRDASGNYTYQYVADQDAIAKAEEELAAAENNLYNIDKERNKSLVDTYYATMTEANEAIAEAMAQGDTERVERLREHYFGENGMIAGIQSELKASSSFLKEIGALVTGEEFSDNITRVADQITSMQLNGEDGLFAKINELIGKDGLGIEALSDATGTISELLNTDGILQTVVNSVAATQKDATTLATEVTELSNAADSVINKLPNLVSNVKALADELDKYADKYNEWLSKQIDTTEIEANTAALGDLTRSINELKDTLDDGVINGSVRIEGWNWDETLNMWVNDTTK